MENSFFIFSDKTNPVSLERFHLCTWEFKDNTALIEFGGEILNPKDKDVEYISLNFFIPWLTSKCVVTDLYDKLKESENSRFIFNDSIKGNKYLDSGQKKEGVVQEFESRNPLCIFPIISNINSENKIINLKPFNKREISQDTNIYFRFYLEPNIHLISTRKTGVSRSTIIYDIKINEKRNLPENSVLDLREKELCQISNCFCFNIVPNNYDLTFFNSGSLRNIRTIEYESFHKYIGDKRVKKDELVVIFNKKGGKESYNFFSVFLKERIGAGQFALAVLINLLCGILLFIPSYRSTNDYSFLSFTFWTNLPTEAYIALSAGFLLLIYFTWPKIILYITYLISWVKLKFRKT